MKYPIFVLTGALALIAADPTPPPPPPALPSATPVVSPSASPPPTSEYTALPEATPNPSVSPGSTPLPGLGQPGGHHKGGYGASATPSPPPVRKGLDGVWEVQIQRGPNTDYEHFNITQSGSVIAGTYLTHDNKRYPISGALDGSNVRLVVSLPDGSTILLEARVDNTTDMLGMFTDSKERVPFTAAYRAKEKWIENVNASPGGLGGQGGYQPPK